MSLESVKEFFADRMPSAVIEELSVTTATVADAALAYGVEPGRIGKTLSVRVGERVVLVVVAGDARLDNRKSRDALGAKPRMLSAEEVVALTGHPVGGVCPFGLATPLQVYCDVSLRRFAEIIPAAGSINSGVRLTPDQIAALTDAEWVDVCQERTGGEEA
ncbi:MAG: YbaK/EbsC family protein [Candidatus Pacebacteria bacterium]|nr:YbaK/EbsC family protein [Candidatus Paceibacterota bacterium]